MFISNILILQGSKLGQQRPRGLSKVKMKADFERFVSLKVIKNPESCYLNKLCGSCTLASCPAYIFYL